ncbi:MAG: hypothetical protein ACLP9S_00430 [Syntrophales bacterium]
MRKGIIVFFCAFVIAASTGCEPSYRTKSPSDSSRKTYTIAKATYDISLISVEKSTGAKEIGEQRIETVIEMGLSRFYFEDEMVRIKWLPTPYDIVFVLNSKTDGPVSIVWNDARFIDEKGVSHRLIHSGIGYEDRNNTQPPTVVAARGSLEDFVHPADYFQKEEDYGWKSNKQQDYWKRAPFLPAQIKGTAKELRTKAEPFVGKTFQVMLALQIDDLRNDYLCTFKINRIDVKEELLEQDKGPDNREKGKSSGRGIRY